MYGTELSGTDGLLETFILRDQQADNFFSRLSEIDMAGDISFSEGTAIPEITAIDKMGIDDSDAGAGNVNCSVTPLALSEYINGVGAYNGQGKVDSLKTYADHAALAHGYTADTCTAFNTIKDVVGAKDLVVDTGDATFEQIYRTGDGLSASYLAGAGNEIDLVAGDFSSGGTGGYIAFAVITGASSVDGVGIGSPNGSGDGYSGFDIGRGVNYMYPGTANGLAGTDYVTFPALGVVDAEWDGKVQAYCEYFDPETAGIWKFGMHENLSNPVIVEGTRSGNGGTWTDRPAPGPFMKFSRDHAFKFHALYVYHLGTSAVPVDTKIKEILRALISSRGTVPPERMKDLT
jgi:hypothetical protein